MNSLKSVDIANFMKANMKHSPKVNAAIFNTMRILKKINPGDTYLEAYQGHFQKRGNTFVDVYHLMWAIGSCLNPEYILEVGCRTGISLCQLLSAMSVKPKEVVLCDVFNDGFISPEVVKMNLKYLNLPIDVVNFKVGESKRVMPQLLNEGYAEKFDYILIDGDHSQYAAAADLSMAVPLLASPGIVLFDDIAEDGCGLLPVWEQFKEMYGNMFYFLENLNGKGVGVGVKL